MFARTVESGKVAAHLDLGKFRLFVPIRMAAAVVVPLAIGLLVNEVELGVCAAIGSFICAVADIGDAYPLRARVMFSAGIAISIAAIIGALASRNLVVVVALSAVVSFVCAYASAIGPRAMTTGMLTLVVFNLFAGGNVPSGWAWREASAVFVGAVFQAAVSISGWPLRRFGGARETTADAWRTLSIAIAGAPHAIFQTEVMTALVTAESNVATSSSAGITREWLSQLNNCAQDIRQAFAAIAMHRIELAEDATGNAVEIAAWDRFAIQVSRASASMAHTTVLPVRHRSLNRTVASATAAAAEVSTYMPAQVALAVDSLHRGHELLTGTLPIGSRGQSGPSSIPDVRIGYHLRSAWNWNSPYLRHAIRLAIVTPVAWILAELVMNSHQYWLPLTVAWITRPEYGGTVGKVVARVVGTLIGLVIIHFAWLVWSPGAWGLAAIVFVSAYGLYVLLPVNYALAVICVTSLVVSLIDELTPLHDSALGARALATVLAGILVLIAVRIAPVFSAPHLPTLLADLVTAIRPYAHTVLCTTTSATSLAAPIVSARIRASAAVENAKLEPRANCMDPYVAERVLDAQLACLFAIVTLETARDRQNLFTAGQSNADDPAEHTSEANELETDLDTLKECLLALPDREVARRADEAFDGPANSQADAAVRRAIHYTTGDLQFR